MIKFLLPALYWVVAFFLTLPSRHSKRYASLMLVSERGDDARDNGYHFFLYVKQHHPEIDAYYIITDDSPDRQRLAAYEDHLVRYLSFRHCMLFWRARYLVSTHLRAGHTPLPFAVVKHLNRLFHIYSGKKLVTLKHGITSRFQKRLFYENTHYDLFVCGAAPERDIIVKQYHYPPSVARYTGFCRFDKLLDFQVKRQILVMPTWRKYLGADDIPTSTFFLTFHRLLADSRLAALLEEHGIDLIFYPHYKMQPYVEQFKQGIVSPRVIVADLAHYDVQQLLKDSALLVTDYSSVFFDFAYMRKPVVSFQFDSEEFYSKHLPKGYVDANAFGPVVKDIDSLIATLADCVQQGMVVAPEYGAFVDTFFPLRDTRNCERVFDAVMHC